MKFTPNVGKVLMLMKGVPRRVPSRCMVLTEPKMAVMSVEFISLGVKICQSGVFK